MEHFLFRHEKPRKFQVGLLRDIYSAISRGGIFLANAPTGSGKTDAAMSAALTYALETGLSVFFLTPKISQHKIALEVVNGIVEKSGAKIRAIDLVGRKHLCPTAAGDYDNESFQHFCENKRKRKNCGLYNNVRALDFANEKKLEGILEEYGSGKSFLEAVRFASAYEMCPYELLLRIGERSNAVIADYYHFLVPRIRDALLARMNKRMEDCIVVVDEAHNLAGRARNYLSATATAAMIAKAEKELAIFGFESRGLYEKFAGWAAEVLGKKSEVVIEKTELDILLRSLGDELLADLQDAGATYVQIKAKKSAALKLAAFLAEWENEIESVRIVESGERGFRIAKKILDPSVLTSQLNNAYATVLMSGTLQPFEMHIDVLGLDKGRTEAKDYPSPFPESNILNVIATTATTRYAERNAETYARMADEITRIIEATPGGIALFFASYNVMNGILPLIRERNIHEQQSRMKPYEIRRLMKNFSESGGVLCGVQGGSLAEGVDFCNEEIKSIVIVGVGLEEMNAEIEALIKYYEKRFGKGWEYAYLYPGTVKALQAAGRARRKESDRVAVVYLDERFRWKNYGWIFGSSRPIVTANPARLVKSFWQSNKK